MVEAFPPGHLLVLRPTRSGSTTPARALPPPRARRSPGRSLRAPVVTGTAVRRNRGRSWAHPLAAGTVLLGAALLLVAQSAAATQASYQISALQQEQARLSSEGDQLRFQLAQARAAKQVDSAAQALGLNRPPRLQYLAESRSPIALAPRVPDANRGSVWRGVVAILSGIAGAPLDVEARAAELDSP